MDSSDYGAGATTAWRVACPDCVGQLELAVEARVGECAHGHPHVLGTYQGRCCTCGQDAKGSIEFNIIDEIVERALIEGWNKAREVAHWYETSETCPKCGSEGAAFDCDLLGEQQCGTWPYMRLSGNFNCPACGFSAEFQIDNAASIVYDAAMAEVKARLARHIDRCRQEGGASMGLEATDES